MNIISNQERKIFKIFIENKIPEIIKWENINELDLMEHYEELFNCSSNLLESKIFGVYDNLLKENKLLFFNKKYKQTLLELLEKDDIDLKIHCYLCLLVITILEKYSKQ